MTWATLAAAVSSFLSKLMTALTHYAAYLAGRGTERSNQREEVLEIKERQLQHRRPTDRQLDDKLRGNNDRRF